MDVPEALARERATTAPMSRRGPCGPHGPLAPMAHMVKHRVTDASACCDHPMTELRVRAAAPEDLDTVLAFWKVAAEGTSISDDRTGVERLVARDPEALILALAVPPPERSPAGGEGGELVGTVIAGFDGWRCHLYRLAVHPDHRRRGIASALLAAAEERFVRLGGRRADAMVLQRNETAHRAWGATGYAPEERWRRWVKPLTG